MDTKALIFNNKRRLAAIWISGLLLVISGLVYRLSAERIRQVEHQPVSLAVPLSEFPMSINGWEGESVAIDATTRDFMEKNFADDYLNRRYSNATRKEVADLYMVYCTTKPGGILGHWPGACYPANGWIHDGTKPTKIQSKTGREIPCFIYEFHKPAPDFGEVIVLCFYLVNGHISTDEKEISSFWGRRINIDGDPARYVAQIQVSSTSEQTVKDLCEVIADQAICFFPESSL